MGMTKERNLWKGRAETEASALEKDRPPSRESAKIMRETEVTVASPQRNCEMKIATYSASFTVGLT